MTQSDMFIPASCDSLLSFLALMILLVEVTHSWLVLHTLSSWCAEKKSIGESAQTDAAS